MNRSPVLSVKMLFCFWLMLISWSGRTQDKKLFSLLSPSSTGIDFRNQIVENQKFNALNNQNLYNGGGVAVGDINNDGLDDIYFNSNMGLNQLYLNLGDLKFKNITASAGVSGREGWKSGVTMVDINGDHLLDIYVCYSGKTDPERRRNQFFINKGDLTFEDKAKEYGLDANAYSTHAAFLDYDLDGDLDMFLLTTNVKVIHEIEYKQVRKATHPYAGDKLFRNDNGHFTEVTESVGILSNALGFGLGVAVSDFNKDGWPDIHVSNDYMEPDYLYINNKNGTFTNKLSESLQHISQFSMGSDVADINNDAWPDLFTTDMLPEDNKRQKLLYGPENYEQYALQVMNGFHFQNMRNMLHLNNANGTFSEIGQLAGISNTDWSWAPLFADYDNDGWKDLFVTNGYFRDYTNRDFLKFKGDYYFNKVVANEKIDTLELSSSMKSTPLHNYLFRSNGDLTFTDQSNDWGMGKKGFSNGAVYSDLDNDGDLDLVVSNQNEVASLYKNSLREQHANTNFIALQLVGTRLNTRGWGSKIEVYSNGKMQYLEQMPVRGYQSTVSDRIHIGVGTATEIDSIKITWPYGTCTYLYRIKANQMIEVEESLSERKPPLKLPPATPLFTPAPTLGYQHQEYGANDFKRQPLLLTMLSPCGPIMATADVNGDGLEDVYMGGAQGSSGKLYLQTADGGFRVSPDLFTNEKSTHTDADARFFDADNDGDMDLYVVSGGYHEYKINDAALQDRLYINDGRGRFLLSADALPPMGTSKSCVRALDVDKDGDLDVFVGGRMIPGNYPISGGSYLLVNDGTGHFKNVTSTTGAPFQQLGMITDAVPFDANGDGYDDLLMAGEFMSLSVFLNQEGKSFKEEADYFDKNQRGMWSRLAMADFDHDGDADFVAGNFGLNSQLKASPAQPITLVYKDFDKNGSVDPVMSSFIQGKSYPFASRDELLDQLYGLRKKFTSYELYSEAQLNDIFTKEELKGATVQEITTLQTTYFENRNGRLVAHALPIEAQFAPVYAMEVIDYNKDGHLDFILAGNQRAIRIRLGVVDASYGQLFEGDGKGNFKYIPQLVSGLRVDGDVRSMRKIMIRQKEHVLFGVNNNKVESYRLNR